MPLVTILAVALFALTLVLAACGGTDTEVTSSSTPPPSSPQTTVSEGAAAPHSSTTSIPEPCGGRSLIS